MGENKCLNSFVEFVFALPFDDAFVIRTFVTCHGGDILFSGRRGMKVHALGSNTPVDVCRGKLSVDGNRTLALSTVVLLHHKLSSKVAKLSGSWFHGPWWSTCPPLLKSEVMVSGHVFWHLRHGWCAARCNLSAVPVISVCRLSLVPHQVLSRLDLLSSSNANM